MPPVQSAHITGTWFRHIVHEGDPWFWPDPPASGRWQDGNIVQGIYLADSIETMWAEWYRALSAQNLAPRDMLPRDIWQWQVDLENVADIRERPALEELGVDVPRPSSEEWPACQDIGHQLWRDGYSALIAPSAARPVDGTALCVFRSRPHIDGLTPIPPPSRQIDAPVPPRGMTT